VCLWRKIFDPKNELRVGRMKRFRKFFMFSQKITTRKRKSVSHSESKGEKKKHFFLLLLAPKRKAVKKFYDLLFSLFFEEKKK
jgi:hypothetical protein